MAGYDWNAVNTAITGLGNTYDDIRKERESAPLRALQMRMLEQKAAEGDISLENARVSAADRLAYRQKLAGAQPTTETTITPRTQAATALLSPPVTGQPQEFASPQEPAGPIVQAYNEGRVQSKTTQPDYASIAREELMRQGDFKGAAGVAEATSKIIDVEELLAKKRQEVNMYGSPEQKAQLDIIEKRLDTVSSILKKSKEADPSGALTRQMIKAHPELFPGVDSDKISIRPDGITQIPFNGGSLVVDPSGKAHIIQNEKKNETWSEPYPAQVGGKRVMLQKSSTGQVKPVVQDTSTTIKIGSSGGLINKPIPASALKMQQEDVEAIGIASSIKSDLGAIKRQIESGNLKLGPIRNIANIGLNMAGVSTAESRKLQTFRSTLEKLRNDSLRLNKGVQTEGDAQRAWNEMLTNINDPKLVSDRLSEIESINERAVMLKEENINNIRENYGKPPLDLSKQKNVKAAIGVSNKPAQSGRFTVEEVK